MRERAANPIIPGFYPDPSICRVGEDYYLVTSTFVYFPGVPIFRSKDLVHWEQIGNVLDRKEQVKLSGVEFACGIYAPTLRYHDGIFYMITTNVGNGGNFVVTAKDPAGPWSNPYFIEGAEGIDPSLFFDDDGKCYYTGTKGRREGGRYGGDNEIWLQELDINSMKLVGESYAIWHGALKEVVWPEGPHLYKVQGQYYLMIAEGGTDYEHAVTVASSASLKEPFKGYSCNPILTHRHLGREYPIVNVGHADLVETQNGEWYMVALASRPYGGYYRNLGRETFLAPVTWERGWPVVNKGIGKLEDTVVIPNLPTYRVTPVPEKEDFDSVNFPYHFLFIRNPMMSNYSLTDRKGFLRMKLAPEQITELVSSSYAGVRQTGMSFELETKMEFRPACENEEAGLMLLQSNQFNYRFVLTLQGKSEILKLIKCYLGKDEVLAKIPTEASISRNGSICLRITAKEQEMEFAYSFDGSNYHIAAGRVDARMLSTDVAGGFVGTTVGMYCSSNGKISGNHADYDWFSYKNI